MTMIRPETEMKDSGIQWLGNIPKEWSIIKGKYILKQLSRSVLESDNVVTCFRDGEVTLRSNRRELGFTNSLKEIGYQGVEPGDLVVHGMDGFAGAIGISDSRGKMSPIINVLESGECKKYLMYYLRGLAFVNVFLGLSTGIRERSCDLRWNKLANLEYTIPPLSEQQAVADYLDETCSKIDEIIAEAKASIDEYKELKQAVIFEAVTKGLDKNVEMKQCSVNWLDEIPSTWKSIRLKYLLTEINNRSETGTEQPLSVSQVMGVVPSYMISVVNPTSSYVGQKVVEPNDIVFNKLKAHLGVFFMSKYYGLVSPDYAVYRTNDKVIPKYLEYLFHTSACISEFKRYITGVAEGLMRLYTSDLFNIRICLPNVDEQIKIVEYVDNNVDLFDSLIAEKESLIHDLEAYKKSLIYEVVTGKRKVV